MNLSTKIIGFIIILFFANTIPAQECKSKLNIRTDLSTSLIYLNHKLVGHGNASLEVEKGKYDITIMGYKNEWGSNVINDSVVISDCGITKKLNYSLTNQVYLDSSPQDAQVYAADSLIGFTPLFLPEKYKTLKLEKTDYESREISLADITKNEPVSLEFLGEEDDGHFYNKAIFKFLIGGIIALGASTVYFKLKADNAYDDYKSSNDQSYLDKTHKYDTLSGISFGILQVNFGILIYYFLTE